MDLKTFPFQIQEVDATMYIRHSQREQALALNEKERYLVLARGTKTRPIDIEGVYKASKVYQVTLTEKDIPVLKSIADKKYFDLSAIADTYFKTSFFVFKDEDTVLLGYKDFPVTFKIALVNDFIKCEMNKKEEQILEKINEENANLKMVELTVKTNILNMFKAKNIGVVQYVDTIQAKSVEAYNKLIDTALEYYFNSIVKELGCTIKIAAVNKGKQHCRHTYDALFRLKDIELNLEQHINSQTKGD